MKVLIISPDYPQKEFEDYHQLCVSAQSATEIETLSEIDLSKFNACVVDIEQNQKDGIAVCEWLAHHDFHGQIFILSRLNQAFSICMRDYAQQLGLPSLILPSKDHCKFILDSLNNRRLELEHELDSITSRCIHYAIEKGEFFPVFQPKYSLFSQECVGLEVLSRWQHPTHGLISPARFIPLINKLGMDKAFNHWLFHRALSEVITLDEHYRNVSFNLSVNHLQDVETSQFIMNCLGLFKLHPSQITIEVTEDTFMAGQDKAIIVLKLLKDIGVHISLDDFGTGYSSLQQLISFHFNEIKLDRCFLKDVPGDKNNHIILETALTLAQKFETRLILEGIETKEQEVFVRRIGAKFGQGFLYSKPKPIDEIREFLEHLPQHNQRRMEIA